MHYIVALKYMSNVLKGVINESSSLVVQITTTNPDQK